MKNVDDIYALTPLQQLMLLHAANSQANDRSEDVLLEQFSCTLVGPFDVQRFRQAWSLVAKRHPALRTAFAWVGLKARVQVVRREVAIPWRELNLRPSDDEDLASQLATIAEEERFASVDPRTAPLFKMLLIHGSRQEKHFLWTCHHLIFDGWCLPLLLKEVFANYQALSNGRPAPLTPAKPFRDYVAWLARRDETQSLDYWRRALAGAPSQLALAIDFTPEEIAAATLPTHGVSLDSPRTNSHYHQHEQLLSPSLTRDLQNFVSKHKLTLGAVLEGAWAILLSRYGETNDLVIGVTVSGRPPELPGVETIVGPFANTLPLRIVIDPHETAVALLARARGLHVDLAAHEHTPLPDIQAACGYTGRLFDSVVVLENYPLGAGGRDVAGLAIRDVKGDVATNYPLTLIAIPGETLALRLRYDRRRYGDADVKQMLAHFATLLAAIGEQPEKPVAELSLVSADEAKRLFDEWSRSPTARSIAAASAAESAADDCLMRGWEADPLYNVITVGNLPPPVLELAKAFSQFSGANCVHQETPTNCIGREVVIATSEDWRRTLAGGWQCTSDAQLVCAGPLPRKLANELLSRSSWVWRLSNSDKLGVVAFLARVEPGDGPIPLGKPLAGVEVHVLDARGQPSPIGLPGELCLRKIGDGEPCRRTGQAVRWRSNGQIETLGSIDAPARNGRYRLDPNAAQTILDSHPLVEDAHVAPTVDTLGAVRLAAYIAPVKESATLLDSQHHAFLLDRLRADLALQLPEYQAPSLYAAVARIPRLPSGEVDTSALPALARRRPEAAGEYVAPRDLLEAQLTMLWQDVLGVAPVGMTDDFHDLGGVSVQAVSLAARVEERFGRKLPLVSVFQQATIAGVAELLRREPASAEESCLAPIRPMKEGTENKTPLFCVHPAGGTVFCYLELARHLPADQPLYGLQAQGIDGAAAPHDTVEEMAAHYIKAMRLVQPHGPYMVCGWSSGGILAFEVARQLAEAGEETKLLALFDAGVADPDNPFEESDLAPMLKMLFPEEDQERAAELENLPPDEQLAYFRERAELAQLVVAGADASQASFIFEVFRKNVQAIAAYKPSPYPGKITLFRAQAHATPMHRDEFLGWGRWASEVEAVETPGDHVTMFREPTIRIVAEKLAAVLAKAIV
jgi:thioesterase domain-containing protein/acyl carrier protein